MCPVGRRLRKKGRATPVLVERIEVCRLCYADNGPGIVVGPFHAAARTSQRAERNWIALSPRHSDLGLVTRLIGIPDINPLSLILNGGAGGSTQRSEIGYAVTLGLCGELDLNYQRNKHDHHDETFQCGGIHKCLRSRGIELV
jgi:hypothetical protein